MGFDGGAVSQRITHPSNMHECKQAQKYTNLEIIFFLPKVSYLSRFSLLIECFKLITISHRKFICVCVCESESETDRNQ